MKISALHLKRLLFAVPVVLLYLQSCGDEDLSIGKDFIRSDTYTELIDSVSLRFATIRPDSIQTSATEVALVGSYRLQGLGRTTSSSFVPFTYSDGTTVDKRETYDSLTLVLRYTGYSEGDTLKEFSFNLHRLTGIIDSEYDLFYNTSSFEYNADTLATFRFKPRPNKGKDLEFKMPDELGNEFWDLLKNNKLTQSDFQDKFEDTFRGLVFKADENNTWAMLGFEAIDSTSMVLRIHSHISTVETENIVRRVYLKSTAYQFNKIVSEPEEPALALIGGSKGKATESTTDNSAFVQAGSGYSTRIDFPFLQKLKETEDNGRIVKAILMVAPNMDYQKWFELPQTVNIATITKINEIQSYLTDSQGTSLTGNLVTDPILNESNYYTFDITSYINSRLSDDVILPDQGLVITIPTADYNSSVKTLVLGGYNHKEYKSSVKIYYYKYDKN